MCGLINHYAYDILDNLYLLILELSHGDTMAMSRRVSEASIRLSSTIWTNRRKAVSKQPEKPNQISDI